MITNPKRTSPSKAVMRDVNAIREEMSSARTIERIQERMIERTGHEAVMLRNRYNYHCSRINTLLNGDKYHVEIGQN